MSMPEWCQHIFWEDVNCVMPDGMVGLRRGWWFGERFDAPLEPHSGRFNFKVDNWKVCPICEQKNPVSSLLEELIT